MQVKCEITLHYKLQMLCNLLWVENTTVNIHDRLRVAHTRRNGRDHNLLFE